MDVHGSQPRFRRRLANLMGLGLAVCVPALAVAATDEGLLLSPRAMAFVRMVPAFLLGIGLHEWAHAWTAHQLGDPTPSDDGRLSLNPLDHLDPLGTLFIAAAQLTGCLALGWGRAVEVSPRHFREPLKDMARVAAAGPLMNLLIASVGLILVHFQGWIYRSVDSIDPGSNFWFNLSQVLEIIVTLNVSLAIFNLLPIPPLDGAAVLANYLSADKLLIMRQIEPFGMLILLGMVQHGSLAAIYAPVFKGVQWLQESFLGSVAALSVMALVWWVFTRSLRRFRPG